MVMSGGGMQQHHTPTSGPMGMQQQQQMMGVQQQPMGIMGMQQPPPPPPQQMQHIMQMQPPQQMHQMQQQQMMATAPQPPQEMAPAPPPQMMTTALQPPQMMVSAPQPPQEMAPAPQPQMMTTALQPPQMMVSAPQPPQEMAPAPPPQMMTTALQPPQMMVSAPQPPQEMAPAPQPQMMTTALQPPQMMVSAPQPPQEMAPAPQPQMMTTALQPPQVMTTAPQLPQMMAPQMMAPAPQPQMMVTAPHAQAAAIDIVDKSLTAPNEVDAWLTNIQLGPYGYGDTMRREGYDKVIFLACASDAELARLADVAHMVMPHKNVFLAESKKLAQQAAAPQALAAPTNIPQRPPKTFKLMDGDKYDVSGTQCQPCLLCSSDFTELLMIKAFPPYNARDWAGRINEAQYVEIEALLRANFPAAQDTSALQRFGINCCPLLIGYYPMLLCFPCYLAWQFTAMNSHLEVRDPTRGCVIATPATAQCLVAFDQNH
jgi:hypothetical protein